MTMMVGMASFGVIVLTTTAVVTGMLGHASASVRHLVWTTALGMLLAAPFIAASGALHRYVAAQTQADRDLGEAYYLLGVIESHIGRTFWASQTESFLEAAIRVGPGEPYAEQAFELLEEFVVAGYPGSGGEHVPPDVRKRRADLRELIDEAQANRGEG